MNAPIEITIIATLWTMKNGAVTATPSSVGVDELKAVYDEKWIGSERAEIRTNTNKYEMIDGEWVMSKI